MTQQTAADRAPSPHKWRWIMLAGAVCLLSWLALGVGLMLDVGTTTTLVLATVAALATEGTVWQKRGRGQLIMGMP